MKIRPHLEVLQRGGSQCGAALLLSLLILLVLVAIVIQINVSTGTDARIGRNDIAETTMDLAAESAMLQVVEMLKSDGDAESSTAGAPGGSSAGTQNPASATGAAGAPGAQAAPQQPCDSRRDEWANPQRTEINGIKLRIICQDENSKYNILNMLSSDEKEAQAAFDRVVRILDACREGTQYDIDPRTAEEMAKTMLDSMVKRKQSKLPRPKLLTDDEKKEDIGLPLTLREFMPLQPFEDYHFKDFRDSDGKVVHSITTFLTVWSSLGTAPITAKSATSTTGKVGTGSRPAASNTASKGSSATSGSSTSGRAGGTKAGSGTQTGASGVGTQAGSTSAAGKTAAGGTGGTTSTAGGQNSDPQAGTTQSASTTGGYGVNVNTAPAAVLKSLFDDRDVSSRFWDKVIEYRNLEDEEEKEKAKEQAKESGTEEEEERLDEYGQPLITRRIFASIADLSKVDGYSDLSSESQAKVNAMLSTQSEVFSVFVIARKTTSVDSDAGLGATPAEMRKQEETTGDALLRVIHAVYWRHKQTDETQLTPILRWEALDYLPYEVLDFPPEDR